MKYFLGFDVGSSKTHAMIVDETGRCAGFGSAGSGNHQGVGYDGLETALKSSLSSALSSAGLAVSDLAAAGIGAAGYDFPSDRPPHMEVIARLGLSCPVEIVNDGLNGLLAGASRGIGVNVTAGSSNNCRGRNSAGQEGRIVGNGTTFGENGGAMEIVLMGLQKVNHAWIRRIPPTALTAIFLRELGARDEMDLMEGLSNERLQLTPALAVHITAAAQAGDAAANEIITWAGEELGWLAVSVARQIGMQDEEVEIIQSGSVFNAGPIITGPMRRIVLQNCPHAKLIRLRGLPVIGAVMLGMEQAGFDGYPIRENMIRTSPRLDA